MVLLKQQKRQLNLLRRLAKGTNVKITMVNNIGIIKISGGRKGSKPLLTQLGNTVGLSPMTIVRARVKLFKRR